MGSSSGSDDDCWEEVDLSAAAADEREEEPTTPMEDISFTLSSNATKKRKGITKEDRMARLFLHRAQVVCWISHSLHLNSMCDSDEVQAIMLSHIHQDIWQIFSSDTRTTPVKAKKVRVRKSSRRKVVAVDDDDDDVFETAGDDDISRNGAEVENVNFNGRIGHLLDEITHKFKIVSCKLAAEKFGHEDVKLAAQALSGSPSMFCLVLYIYDFLEYFKLLIVYFLSVPARLVHNVSVLNLSFSKSTSIASPPAPTGQKTARKRKRKVKSSDVSDVSDEEEDVVKVEDVQHTFIWAEILDPETKEWLYVNPIRRYELGHSKIVYDCLKGKISYIFAFEPKSRRIKDVTVKYVSTLQLKKCRDNLWIDETIRNHFQSHPPFDSEADQLENEKFADLEDACEPPTTISGFLNHPKYVLERHLKKFETIHPKVAVPGKSIRGESIYLRANVCTLHTADKWLSLEGRVVKREERGHPIKYVKSRAYSSSKNSEKGKIVMLGEEEGEEDAENMHNSGKVAVFGIWQTEVYVPAPIVNGIIPKNKYNNFDLFKPSMLPPGAAHITEESLVDDAEREYNEIQIRLPSLKKIARKLKCDFAEAVIGFEYHGGRSVPTINGIIVAQENEEAVRKEFMSQLFEQMETFRESKFTDAVRRWERLTKKALIYERLKKKFLK